MYEFIIDSVHTVLKNGLTLSTFLAIIVLIFKQRRMKRRIRKFLPWMFEDETKEYVTNQQRIERKIDIIGERLGVEWNATISSRTNEYSTRAEGTSSITSSAGKSRVQYVLKAAALSVINLIRRVLKMAKFKSRKFWIAIISAILVVLNDGLDLGIDQDTVIAFSGIVMSFIFGEAWVDSKKVAAADPDKEH